MTIQFHKPTALFLVSLAGLFGMVGCASTGPPRSAPKADRVMYQWYDDYGPGEVSVRIRLRDQIAEFRRGGRDIGWSFVTTGREGYGTKPGTYRITEKVVDKYSNRYGWLENEYGEKIRNPVRFNVKRGPGERFVPSPMPYWMRLTSYGIGMHAGPIPQPGETASHGCIRLPEDFAPVLFHEVNVGTRVRIVY